VWTILNLYHNILIINYLSSYKYAHEIIKTQFFDLQLLSTISVVRKLKLMKIDEVSKDYKVIQSKI